MVTHVRRCDYEALERRAAAEGVSLGHVVREILESALRRRREASKE